VEEEGTVSEYNLKIEVMPITALKPYAHNPRTHSAKQLRQIADSIRQFGFINPVLIDPEGGVIAGHGRLEAGQAVRHRARPLPSGWIG